MITPTLLAVGIVLVVVQFLAALPWLLAANLDTVRSRARGEGGGLLRLLGWVVGGVVVGGGLLAVLMAGVIRNPNQLHFWGGFYAALLQAQLTVDVFVVAFTVLLRAWPKGGAVALAAFREGVRHPMFWFMLIVSVLLLVVTPILPYFTFGEDFKMVKDLGYSTIMLFPAAFGVLAASMLISEEIEGRTAITLMSKPVSRRQFLLGRFAGLLLACLAMAGVLTWIFDGMLVFKLNYDREEIPVPGWLANASPHWASSLGDTAAAFLHGSAWWGDHVANALPGVVLGFCQVMVLLAIAVALATRLPMIVNVNTCLVIFFLGNLTPVLTQASQGSFPLVRFIAQLFDTLLPSLEFFNLGPAIARETPPPALPFMAYIGSVALYASLYTCISLLVGLLLFEDRDLA